MEIWLMNVRLAFADGVFEKSGIAGDPKSKARYGSTFIIAAGDPQIEKIRALEEKICLEHEWKGCPKGTTNAEYAKTLLATMRKKGKSALKDGDDKAKFDGFSGNFFIAASNDTRPTAVNRDKSPLTAADGVIYSGCYVNAKVDIWPQDNSWGERLNTDFLGIQFVKDGDSFSAGSAPANPDEFPNLDAGGEDDDADPFG